MKYSNKFKLEKKHQTWSDLQGRKRTRLTWVSTPAADVRSVWLNLKSQTDCCPPRLWIWSVISFYWADSLSIKQLIIINTVSAESNIVDPIFILENILKEIYSTLKWKHHSVVMLIKILRNYWLQDYYY